MSCCVGCRRGSNPELLWLWHRPVATARVRPLAWEPPYAMEAALEMAKRQKKTKKKDKKRQKKKKKPLVMLSPLWVHSLGPEMVNDKVTIY